MKQSNLREKYPLSSSQERIWFLSQLEPHNPAYNFSSAVQITGELNFPALQKALQMIVNRHTALRTTFRIDDGNSYQVIAETVQIEPLLIDISFLPEVERKALMRNLVQEETVYPFDLKQGPLIRSRVLKLGNQDHVFLISIHHIVWDAWSWWVMWRELSVLYNALQQAETPHLDPLPIQYADYALRQRKGFKEEALQLQEAYWKQKFWGKIPILDLPTDRPRPTVQSYQGSSKSITLEVELAEQLRKLALQTRTSLFIVLLAAFKVLLFRYSRQEDLIIGAPFAGRNYPNTKYLIGCFVNTLALRTNLSAELEFTELIMRVSETVSGAYNNQDYPFERLVETINPDRDLSRSPLFQVMFAFRDILLDDINLSGLKLNTVEIESQTAKFDLTVSVSTGSKELEVKFEYNIDLYNRITITRMLGHFQVLLEGIVANPEQCLSDLPLLTPAEQHQLLVEWNNTQTDYPNNTCIHQLFEAQVERTPNAVAVVFEDEQLTYQELNRRANQLAHYLQKLGVKPEILVGICLERSPLMLVGLLGILKAGGAYVPLDPDYPADRLAFMVQDSQIAVLLTQNSLIDQFYAKITSIICLDADWDKISQECTNNRLTPTTLDQLAYVIYTSGSTGTPKGVLGLHRGIINRCHWMWQVYPFETHEICCQKTSLSFVDSVWEIFGPLLQGIRLVILPNEVVKDPNVLIQTLSENQITRIVLVPSLLKAIVETPIDFASQLIKLKYWFTSGEVILSALAKPFQCRIPQGILINLYGSSEVSADVTYYDARSNSIRNSVPIGRPITNTQVYILDSHLNPVPIGVPNELYIGGDGLARGYLNRPELTEEKFIPNPFNNPKSKIQNPKLYKTGDLARYLPDGNIEFLGRIDNQVKIRGFRIELGEVEATLSQHSAIEQTVVIARDDISDDKRLVAYLVLSQDQTLTVDELRLFLQQKLPSYMIPSAFIFLDALPLTPNGKIDRHALPAPDQTRLEQEGTFVAPRDELELQLTQIWEKVLGIQPIGIKDNFFDLGGHSLLAVRLVAEIDKAFDKKLALATLFQAPTVEQLAKVLRDQEWKSSWYSLIPLQPSGSCPPLFGIHLLYFHDLSYHLGSEQPIYGLHYGMGETTDKEISLPTLENLAAHYIQEMRSLQPEGPYYLMGLSFGGVIAYEMAQQLVIQGQQVAFLGLFDTLIEDSLTFLPLHQRFSKLFQVTPSELLRKIKTKIKGKLVKHDNKYLPHVYNPNLLRIMREAYTPQVYSGRVTLFKAMNHTSVTYAITPPEVGWRKFVNGELEIHEVPGSHLGMLEEPNVKILAEKMRACIEKSLNNE
jgi:aspartate racemase